MDQTWEATLLCDESTTVRGEAGVRRDAGLKASARPDNIRILTVDDHAVFREGIATVISYQEGMELVAEASNGTETLEQFQRHKPDVTLMDLRLPDMSGVDAMIRIHRQAPGAKVVFLSTFDGENDIHRAMQSGAWGYVLKSMTPKELVGVIRDVHAGKRSVPPEVAARLVEHIGDERLTAREVEVLQRVATGERNRDIGQNLFISEDTVKRHVKQILRKLGASDRTHAIAMGARRGIIWL